MTQQEADELPTHPLLGRWVACNCGHASCDYVHPSRIGSFFQGSGFHKAEAVELTHALKKKWRD